MENIVSKRAVVVRDWEDFLFKYLSVCALDPYDEKKNPMGYLNLGTAVNSMCSDVILPRLTSNDVWVCDSDLLFYRQPYGIKSIRDVFATLMTEFLESHEPVSADDLFFLPGVAACIDLLGHCLADPEELFLVPTPMYGRIYTALKQRSLVDVWPIPVMTENNTEDYPLLTIEKVKNAYENAIAAKRVVRGIFLINPNNPLGDIYSPQLLMDIMSFCKEHSLHVIVDEVYALSVFSKTEKFHSVLKFPNVPDPEKTHVLYGLSKDFALAGLRVGLIHTKCEPLKKCIIQLSNFQSIPFPVMDIAARYLEDLEWCRKYMSTNQKRMAEQFDFCVNFLKKMGFKVRDSPAAFFVWIDFRKLCGDSFDQEMHFFNYLIEKAHLYIGPGKEFFCTQPGWFRLVFTCDFQYLKEGLSRLERAVKAYKPQLNL